MLENTNGNDDEILSKKIWKIRVYFYKFRKTSNINVLQSLFIFVYLKVVEKKVRKNEKKYIYIHLYKKSMNGNSMIKLWEKLRKGKVLFTWKKTVMV